MDRAALHEALGSADKAELESILGEMSEEECAELVYDWDLWARPTERRDNGTYTGQKAPPGDWDVWCILTGRGYGKTRSAAEWVRDEVRKGQRRSWAFIAPDPADARDTMIEGISGILAVSPPSERPLYEPSKKRLTWPNGAIASIFSGEDPEDLRGPEHDGAWIEELCAMRRLQETWDMFNFGFRLPALDGSDPRCVITTTPKPFPILKEIIEDEATVVTTGSTYDNVANLAPAFAKRILRRYEGTRLGQQELHGLILTEAEGANWNRDLIQANRLDPGSFDFERLERIVVGVDPQGRKKKGSETGIVVGGAISAPKGKHYYTLEDASLNASPGDWGERAVRTALKWDADCIVGERNFGGDMVEHVVKTAAEKLEVEIKFKLVNASRGKHVRAEPVAALMEQGREHHVGYFGELESQMCTFTGDPNDPSPDRLDAKVWALSDLSSAPTVGRARAFMSTRVGNPYAGL